MIRVLVKIVWGLAVIVWVGFGMWWGWNNWWKKEDRPKWKLDKTKVVKIEEIGKRNKLIQNQKNFSFKQLRIIQKDPNDTEGRTIIYESNIPDLINGYEGKIYFVGQLVYIKPVSNSKDEEMVLRVRNQKKKFRIVNSVKNDLKLTKWGVEDLSLADEAKIWKDAIKYESRKKIKKMLRINDVVVAVTVVSLTAKDFLKRDKEGRIILKMLFIRRIFYVRMNKG